MKKALTVDDSKTMRDMVSFTLKGAGFEVMEAEDGLCVHSYIKTSNEIGGDLWGIRKISPKRVALYNVDFSGHGVMAAINTFRLHTLIGSIEVQRYSPAAFLSYLNTHLREMLPIGQFATMLYGIIDTEKNIFHYASAGSPAPVLMPKDEKSRLMENTGYPLGIVDDVTYESHSVPFFPGDGIVLYSDALTEAANNKGEYIAEESLLVAVDNFRKRENSTIVESLKTMLERHVEGKRLQDDLTLNVVMRCQMADTPV